MFQNVHLGEKSFVDFQGIAISHNQKFQLGTVKSYIGQIVARNT
jgi:hypothetical protein